MGMKNSKLCFHAKDSLLYFAFEYTAFLSLIAVEFRLFCADDDDDDEKQGCV
jgi:hypothetical protein